MSASQLPTVRRDATAAPGAARSTASGPLVLNRYRLLRRLGAGGFGTVWWAHDERLDREVAVKILPRERVVGGRFEREARAAARLAHPGIVTLYEAAVDDEGAYLVSELVRGATLDDLLDAGRLSDRDVVAVGIALCAALSHAHAHGIVHRDVKPSNILIPQQPATPAQLAKLTDFGVARVVGGDSLTRTGEVIGTTAYMAPEQAEGRDAGPAADLYALALVIYEALTGINPVRTGSAATRARRLGAHLPPLRRQRRDLPPELGQGIDLALRPRPRERGTVEQLRRALSSALAQVDDAPGVVTGPWRSPATRTGRRAEPEAEPFAEPGVAAAPADQPERRYAVTAWPQRGLAALGTAATSAWLASHALGHGSLPLALVALVAGLAVLALPRVGWLAVTSALAETAAVQGRPGAALMLVAGACVPVALLPLAGTAWPLGAGAPALGLVGLAGAWPAFAARSATIWRRAALGLIGWIWLALAASLASAELYLRRPPAMATDNRWVYSLHQTVDHVLAPLMRSGSLAPAPVWALAAVSLPWLVRGRSLSRDLVAVVVWSATVVSATTAMVALAGGPHAAGPPSTAVVGAVAGALVALAPTAARAWHDQRESVSTGAGLA